MKILVIKCDPKVVPPQLINNVVTALMDAKDGQIIMAHPHMKFEVLELSGDDTSGTMFAITDKGKKVKILYDPREDQEEADARKKAKDDFGKMH